MKGTGFGRQGSSSRLPLFPSPREEAAAILQLYIERFENKTPLLFPGGTMQKPRPAPRFLQQERGEEKMKKSCLNRLSVLYPEDVKEKRGQILSWYEVL